jgi:hypothetical protein|tara:strand:- start:11704 stop:12255 length:552 start_codon:yes stop_codon:yes gene_type:complete
MSATQKNHAQEKIAAFLKNSSSEIGQMFDYWVSLRRTRLLPRKEDFDPTKVPNLLRSIWIFRYERQQRRFICNLAGEAINMAWDQTSIAGKEIEAVIGKRNFPAVQERWIRAIETPALLYAMRLDPTSTDPHPFIERFVAPLSDHSGQASHLIGVSLYSVYCRMFPNTPLDSNQFRFLDIQDL